LIVAAIGAATLYDIQVHGTLTLFPPALLAILALIGVALLFASLRSARKRTEVLQQRTAELHALTAQLGASLATVNAVNARLHESEARFKGLVDAQGDAIFRRAPDSRLTYGNDAFFKLFRLIPHVAIGKPFAPELHPDSHAPLFGSFAGALAVIVAWLATPAFHYMVVAPPWSHAASLFAVSLFVIV